MLEETSKELSRIVNLTNDEAYKEYLRSQLKLYLNTVDNLKRITCSSNNKN